MDSVRSLTPVLETGYPELDLPSLNPFEIERFVVSRMSGLTMELLNLKIFNAHKAIISNLKYDGGWGCEKGLGKLLKCACVIDCGCSGSSNTDAAMSLTCSTGRSWPMEHTT